MSRDVKWKRRLKPDVDENLASFLRRWARANGFRSRSRLLRALRLPTAIRMTQANVERLAVILGLDPSVLMAIAPANDPAFPVLRRSLTRARDEAVCAYCLTEASYSRQLWSHGLATACAAHGTRLLDRCTRCGKRIGHERSFAHLCRCGADLRLQATGPATPAEVQFAKLLTGVVPADLTLPFVLAGQVPAELDLFVLGLANYFCSDQFGKPRSKPGKIEVPSSVDDAWTRLKPAFELLEDWPSKFDARLEQMMARPPSVASTGVAMRLGAWYSFLFKKYTHSAFEKFRIAAANRILLSHDGALNARTRNVVSIATVTKNWYSVVESAEILGVSCERINDGIDRGMIEARIHDQAAGYRQRFLQKSEIDRLVALQTENIADETARQVLGVSKTIFEFMDEAGWIERANPYAVVPVVPGLVQHVPLLQLMKRLRVAAQQASAPGGAVVVRLRDLNLRRTTDRQRLVSLFRAIGAGELKPVGDDGRDGIGGLMLLQTDIDSRVASWFVARGLTVEQVSELTSAHYDAVKGWVDSGLLPATREPLEHGAPWVIELKSLVTFLLTYAPLATQAAACGSTSRGIAAMLDRRGLEPLGNPSGRGSVVKISAVFQVLSRKAEAAK